MKSKLPFIIILAVLAVALGSAWYLTRPNPGARTLSNNPPSTAQRSSTTPGQPVAPRGIPGAEPAHTLGAANAPVHLEEFGDYQCPPCSMFHPIVEQMHKEFGDRLRITFRHFPLPNHPHAVAAASSSEAAGLQGKFWEMHDLIYEHQADWKDKPDVRPIFEGYAKQIGLDIERWKRDVVSERIAQRVFLDSRRGQSLGVKGTPTVFLNGRELPFESLFQSENMRAVIQNALNATGRR